MEPRAHIVSIRVLNRQHAIENIKFNRQCLREGEENCTHVSSSSMLISMIVML